MKNTFVRLIALSSATTALFAFTTPHRNISNGRHSNMDTTSFVRMDTAAFNDTALLKDTAAFKDTVLFKDTASTKKDTARSAEGTSIKGKVYPLDAAAEVWAISGTDSLKVSLTDGAFTFYAKPGTYKVVVVAKVPFKDVIKDNVQVADGNSTDLGTIKLQQ